MTSNYSSIDNSLLLQFLAQPHFFSGIHELQLFFSPSNFSYIYTGEPGTVLVPGLLFQEHTFYSYFIADIFSRSGSTEVDAGTTYSTY